MPEITAVPFASELLSNTLAGKLWKTWPRKMALGSSRFLLQFPKPGQLTWETLVMDKSHLPVPQQGDHLSPLRMWLVSK